MWLGGEKEGEVRIRECIAGDPPRQKGGSVTGHEFLPLLYHPYHSDNHTWLKATPLTACLLLKTNPLDRFDCGSTTSNPKKSE